MTRYRSSKMLEGSMIDQAGGHRESAARIEPVIPRIVEGLGNTSGREFFRRLSEQLALAFDACAVRLSELTLDGRHASALGLYCSSGSELSGDFTVEGTPAAEVALGEVVVRESNVRRAYPGDLELSRLFIDGYVGVPMTDAQGDVVGMVELFTSHPIQNAHQACYVLRVLAGRAVAEIERDQAETALRDSEMRYRALIEDSFHLVAEVVDERYIYVSPGYTEALGYEPEALLGGSVFDLVHPDDRQHVAAELKPIAATREAARFTVRLRHSDGSWRWVESTARAFRMSDGGYRTTMFSRDITERLIAEQELRESEARFRLLAEHSTDIIGRYTKDLLCTWISPSIRTITGWEPEEIVGTFVRERIHPDDQVGPEERAGLLPKPGVARMNVVRYRHKDGHYIWLETHTSVVTDPTTGEILEVHNRARDVTARKKAEDQLRESEEQFRLLAENASDVIVRYDAAGTCLWISPSVKTAAGWDPEELMGTEPRFLVHPDDLPLALANRERVLTAREPVRTTFRWPHKDGHYIWVESSARAIRDPETDEVVEIHLSARDISDRKEAEDRVRASEELLRATLEASGDGVLVTRVGEAILYVNSRFAEMFEFDLDALRALGIDELQATIAQRVCDPGQLVRAINELPREGGSNLGLVRSVADRTFEVVARTLPQPDGSTHRVFSVHEVTDLVNASEALAKSEARYRSLSESSPLGVFETDAAAGCTYINRRGLEIAGITLEQALGAGWANYIHPDDMVMVQEAWREIERGHDLSTEYRMRVPRGEIWVRSRAVLMRDEAGQPERYVGTIEDVTEWRRAQDALRDSEAKTKAILDAIPDLMFVLDRGGRYVDHRIPQGGAFSASRALNGLLMEDTVPAELAQRARVALEATFATGEMQQFEYELAGDDGGLRQLECRLSAISAELAVAIVRDMTDERLAERALRESEERLRTVVNSAPVILFAIDEARTIVLSEGRGLAAISSGPGHEVGKNVAEFYEDTPDIIRNIERAFDGERFTAMVDAHGLTFETHYGPVQGPGGEVTGVIGVAYDVSARTRAERALRDSEETARALLNAPTDGAVLIERDGTILALNETAHRRFRDHANKQGEEGSADFVGTCVYDLFPEALREERRARNEQVFEDGLRRHYEDERDGVWTDVTIDPICDAEGRVIRLAVFSRDITDRKRDEEALRKRSLELEALNRFLERTSSELERSQEELHDKTEQLAVLLEAEQVRSKTDPLTGALNHGAISDVMKEAISAEVSFAVAMVDIDGMKAVNDTYGHQTGDAVLLEVVSALNRSGAIVGRYGGDEFMVALLNADQDEARAYKIAVDEALDRANVIDPESGASVPVVASVGIAWYPEDGDTLPVLVEKADERMYEEKSHRRASTGLSSSRMYADDRLARLVGEVVTLFVGEGSLEERFRVAAHRITLAGGYTAASFTVFEDDDDGEGPVANTGAFGRAPEELLDAWNEESRRSATTGVREIIGETREPLIIDDIVESEYVTEEQKAVLKAVEIQSGIVVPLFDGDRLFASMSVGKKELAGFTEADARFLMAIARQISRVVNLARVAERAQRSGPDAEVRPAA